VLFLMVFERAQSFSLLAEGVLQHAVYSWRFVRNALAGYFRLGPTDVGHT